MIRRFLFCMLCGALLRQSTAPVPAADNFLTTPPAVKHARVVIVSDPRATAAFDPQLEVVRKMVARGLTTLTHQPNASAAWRSLVTPRDVVGLKVYSAPGSLSGTRPAVVAAVVEELLAAGLRPDHIIVWDRQLRDLRLAHFFKLADQYGVRVEASVSTGYDEFSFYDAVPLGQPVWGDLEFGRTGPGVGRKSFVTRIVTREVTKIINITPLLNHNQVGVTGNLYGLTMGSVDNTLRFEDDPARLATAVPEIYALRAFGTKGDKVVLSIVDALICQYEGEDRGLLHYSAVLNQLRFSTDPVALDVLSIQELDRQRKVAKVAEVKPNLELYQNATLLELGISTPAYIDVETAP
ncbi:MAG: DUF362 domain-containing protein [Verrucomicrobia bacterium]|nr:DUF362 domain-containing protein [Verrucomicrobiota bacterium]